MALLQAATVSLIALILAPGLFFYFDITPKVVTLLLAAAVSVFFATRSRPLPSLFSRALLLSAISLALSTALSLDPALSVFGANWRRFGAAVQIAILLFAWTVFIRGAGRPDRIRTILRGIALSGALAAMYGIAQYFGWDPLLPAAAYHVGEGLWTIVRPPGTLGYVSYFATWLLFVAFLSLALASMETAALWRRIAYAAAGLSAAAMLLTGTRAAILGLLAGGAVWLWRSRFRPSRRVLAGAAAVVAVCIAFYLSSPGWLLRSRTRWYAEDRWGGGRLQLWRDALRMAAGRPAFGYGPEVFTREFPRFESQALAAAYPDFSYESPHNIFLDALVAQGIPGALLLAAICLAAFRQSTPWMAAALAGGIVGQQFTSFTVPTALIFYVTAALSTALASKAGAPRRRNPALIFTSALVAAALVLLGLRLAVSDRALALAQRSLQARDFLSATAHYARYERWRPPGSSADIWYSRALLDFAASAPNPAARLGALAAAGSAALQATKTAEDPFNAWYNLSAFYARQGNAGETERCLRAAIAAAPRWFKPHWTLAGLLRIENRMGEAEQEALQAVELDGGKHPEVTLVLQDIRRQFFQPVRPR